MKDSDPIFGGAGTGAIAAVLLCAALAALAGEADATEAAQSAETAATSSAAAVATVATVPEARHGGFQRCVDADGRVTLTDAVCPSGSRAVNDDVSDSGAVGVVYNSGGEALVPSAPLGELPRSRWADLPRTMLRKSVTTDVTTLQTARTALLMRDELRRHAAKVASR